MLRAIGLLAVLVGLFAAGEAWGQIYYHADGRGYTNRIGNMTFENYNDGRTVTRQSIGGLQTYSDNRGGYGSTYYSPLGRQDSYNDIYSGRSTYNFTPRPIYTPPVYNQPMFRPYRSSYGW